MAPSGLPSFRPRRAGSSQTRGYAPQTCEALIRPSQPPLGTTEGAVSITRVKHLAAKVAALENPIRGHFYTFRKQIKHSALEVLPFSRSAPPSSTAPGGAFRRSCLSPQGEFCAGRTGRAAQGSRPKADRGSAGRLLCLLSWRRKKVSRPPGRVPANGRWGKGKWFDKNAEVV